MDPGLDVGEGPLHRLGILDPRLAAVHLERHACEVDDEVIGEELGAHVKVRLVERREGGANEVDVGLCIGAVGSHFVISRPGHGGDS